MCKAWSLEKLKINFMYDKNIFITNSKYMYKQMIFKTGMNLFKFHDTVENIVGKEENAGYQHFLFFPQCFHSLSSKGCYTCHLPS